MRRALRTDTLTFNGEAEKDELKEMEKEQRREIKGKSEEIIGRPNRRAFQEKAVVKTE